MILLFNPSNLSLDTIHQNLTRTLGEYDYDLNSDFLIITEKKQKLKLNVLINQDKIAVTPALPFMHSMIILIIIISALTFLMQYLDWVWWLRILIYLISFFGARLFANLLYALQNKKQLKPFQEKVKTKIISILKEAKQGNLK